MGVEECRAPVLQETSLGYHPLCAGVLTAEEAAGHCQAGSLTGAVASQRVTEAREGHLRANGNRLLSVRV